MSNPKPPDNVVPFDRGKGKKNPESELFALLSRIDELEEALETLDEAKVTTREELEELIQKLEAKAAALENPDQS